MSVNRWVFILFCPKWFHSKAITSSCQSFQSWFGCKGFVSFLNLKHCNFPSSMYTVNNKNGITDTCSTADCYPLLPFVAHSCQLLHIIAHCCPLLPNCCPLMPIIVHCCPLMPIIVHSCTLLPIVAHCCSLLPVVAHHCPLLPFVAALLPIVARCFLLLPHCCP